MQAKRIAALLLALLLLLPAGVLAESEELTNTDGFVYILSEDGAAEIVGYTGGAKTLKIPAEIDGHAVTAIGYKAFYSNRALTDVTVPEGVTVIRNQAFGFCSSLKTVRLPKSLTELEKTVFWLCNELKSVNLPSGVKAAGDGLFGGCIALEKINVSENHPYFSVVNGVLFSRPDHRLIWYPIARKNKAYSVPKDTEIIGSYAFAYSKLTQVTVPENVKEIRNNAFSNSKKMKSINIPSKVTKLEHVFVQCTSLTKISVAAENPVFESKNGVLFRKTEKELVLYPSGLKNKTYEIPKDTLAIADGAFSYSQLTGIAIPGSVKKIGSNAFLECNKLKQVTVPEGVEEFDNYVFQNCSQLTEVSLPTSLTRVEANPFLRCKSLKTVKLAPDHPALKIQNDALICTLDQRLVWYSQTAQTKKYTVPSGVRIIDQDAFEGCGQLTEVMMQEGVEEIRCDAFASCIGIKAFTLPASLKTIEKSAILQDQTEQAKSSIIYTVPAGSYAEEFCNAYKLKTNVQ